MNEQSVYFKSENLTIEGLYSDHPGENGAIITHPHPQMGGTMNNNVVDALVSVFNKHRYSTLRFNFRGVARSEGFYGNGKGEALDVKAAHNFLVGKGKRRIALTGYSFGAVVDIGVIDQLDDVNLVVLISPPLNNKIKIPNTTKQKGLIICGNEDQFCQVSELEQWAEKLDFKFKIVEGTDHFYWGREDVIINYISDFLIT
ncbi:MAG: dienelactone hydrolase family protein [Deltaproteobacteria bacterium]|nr:dienelactone hydrolase family protein [Deltaproteobacteria bacterium]